MLQATAAAAVSVLLLGQRASAKTFSSEDISGVFEGDPFDVEPAGPLPPPPDGSSIGRPAATQKGNLVRMCGCTNTTVPEIDDIRGISDQWAIGGNRVSSHGLTNLVWAWGQLIDHELVATVDDQDGPAFNISLANGADTANMILHRTVNDAPPGECPLPPQVITPQIDAGVVYGNEPEWLEMTLRSPGTCFLKVSDNNMLPVSTDKVKGVHVFVAGEARVDEHSVLTSMHTLLHREHNRLCRVMMTDSTFAGMSADEMFARARQVMSAKIQQITLREFLPVLGISEDAVRSATPKSTSPEISVEFAAAAYRFGHDMVPSKIGALDAVTLFNGNKFFGIEETGVPAADAESKLASVLRNAAFSLANEIDGKFSDTLRNFLFGNILEDLCARNLFRGRDLAVVRYAEMAECFGVTPAAGMMSETPDPFLGLLRENRTPSTRVIGPTLTAIFTEQFHRIFFAPGGDWWENRLPSVAGFEEEISQTTLSRVIRTNVPGVPLPGNAFNLRDRTPDDLTFNNPTTTATSSTDGASTTNTASTTNQTFTSTSANAAGSGTSTGGAGPGDLFSGDPFAGDPFAGRGFTN